MSGPQSGVRPALMSRKLDRGMETVTLTDIAVGVMDDESVQVTFSPYTVGEKVQNLLLRRHPTSSMRSL